MLSLGDQFCRIRLWLPTDMDVICIRDANNLAVDDYLFLGVCIAAVVSISRALGIWEGGHEVTERRSKELIEVYCAPFV